MNTRSDFADGAAVVLTGMLVAAAAVAIVVLAGTFLELVYVYRERATRNSPEASRLWRALVALLVGWAVCGLAATYEPLVELSAYAAAWSFLAYTLYVVSIDRAAQDRTKQKDAKSSTLSSHLPWPPDPTPERTAPAAVNGHAA